MLLNNCVRQEGKVVVVVRRETFPASSWMKIREPYFPRLQKQGKYQEIRDFYRMSVWFLLVTQEKTSVMSFTSDKKLAEHSIVRGRSVCFYCAESDGSIVTCRCHADKKLLQNRWMCYFPLPYFPFLWTSVECTHDVFICVLVLRPVLLCYCMQDRALWFCTVSLPRVNMIALHINFIESIL